jgi:hypothetical protein
MLILIVVYFTIFFGVKVNVRVIYNTSDAERVLVSTCCDQRAYWVNQPGTGSTGLAKILFGVQVLETQDLLCVIWRSNFRSMFCCLSAYRELRISENIFEIHIYICFVPHGMYMSDQTRQPHPNNTCYNDRLYRYRLYTTTRRPRFLLTKIRATKENFSWIDSYRILNRCWRLAHLAYFAIVGSFNNLVRVLNCKDKVRLS